MATEALYRKIVSTLESEISSSNAAMGSDAYNRFESNLDMLKSAYVEGYNDFVKGSMEAYAELLAEINEITEIPQTLSAFNTYWESAKQ